MTEESISQEVKLKSKNETRNYLTEETNGNELMSKKQKNICTTLVILNIFLL